MKKIFAILVCLMLLACNDASTNAAQVSYITDTLVVTKLDTVIKPMITMDTVIHKDTVLTISKDTTIKLDTIIKNDTSVITRLDTLVKIDTVLKINTVTVTVHDTLINNVVSTIIDTVKTTVHDTLYSKNLFILDFTQWESGELFVSDTVNLNLIANTMMNYNNIYDFNSVIRSQHTTMPFGNVVVNGVTYAYVPGYIYELKMGNKTIDRYIKGSSGQDSIVMLVNGIVYMTGYFTSSNVTLTTNQFKMCFMPYNSTYQMYFNYLADGTVSFLHDNVTAYTGAPYIP